MKLLAFLVVAVAQTHDFKREAGDLLIENEHEGGSQHRLQQFRFQAFKQTKYAVLPTAETKSQHSKPC